MLELSPFDNMQIEFRVIFSKVYGHLAVHIFMKERDVLQRDQLHADAVKLPNRLASY